MCVCVCERCREIHVKGNEIGISNEARVSRMWVIDWPLTEEDDRDELFEDMLTNSSPVLQLDELTRTLKSKIIPIAAPSASISLILREWIVLLKNLMKACLHACQRLADTLNGSGDTAGYDGSMHCG